MITAWESKAEFVCPDCGHTVSTPLGLLNVFCAPKICPKCSFVPDYTANKIYWREHKWRERKIRGVPFVWIKPSSWFRGHRLETKEHRTY